MKTSVGFACWIFATTSLLSPPASAQEFHAFQVNDVIGWVEPPQVATRQLRIFPILSGPGGVYWSTAADPWGFNPHNPAEDLGIAVTGDGRLRFGYRIVQSHRYLPPSLRTQVAQVLGMQPNALANHAIAVMRPRSVTITLEIDGHAVATKSYSADMLTGDVTDYFYLNLADFETISAIQRGAYRLRMDYRAPYSTFGLVSISLSQQILTTAWSEAFREMIRQRRSNSGQFLFFRWRDEVQRVIVRENMRGGANTQITQALNITRIDPSPGQEALIDRALGVVEASRQEVVQLHTAAIAAARSAGQLDLANAHEKYLESLNADPGSQDTGWLDALQALTDDKIMMFLARGFQSSTGSSYSYYRYTGSTRISASTAFESEYNDYIIRNTEAAYTRVVDGNREAVSNAFQTLKSQFFGGYGPQLPNQWRSGVRNLIQTGNLGGLMYAFGPAFVVDEPGGPVTALIDVNARLDANGNTPLHLALDRRNRAMVSFLISQGANPEARNRFQETALDRARTWGDQAIVNAVEAARRPNGTIKVRLTHPQGQLQGANPLNPESTGFSAVQVSPTETEVTVSGHPGMIHAFWMLNYRMEVPASQLPSLQFPYTVVGNSGPNAVILTAVSVNSQYKIFPSETRTYDEQIGVRLGVLTNLR